MTDLKLKPEADLKPLDDFKRKVDDVRNALAAATQAWTKFGEKEKDSADEAERANRAAKEHFHLASNISDLMESIKRTGDHIGRTWVHLLRSTAGVAHNIKEMTVSLMRWAGITSLVSGLAGFVGLRGMEHLGQNVSSSRTAAMGLSSNYGGRQAFLLNYGRFGNAAGVMQNINALQFSSNNRALRLMGLGDGSGVDSADLSVTYLDRVRSLLRNTPRERLQNVMEQRGINEVMGLDFAERLRNTSDEEWSSQRRKYGEDKSRLNLTDAETRRWQDFLTTLETSKAAIQNTFVVSLGALTGPLTKLSEGVVHVIDALVPNSSEDGPIATWLNKMADGLKEFGEQLEGTRTRSAIMDFLLKVKDIAQTLGGFITKLWEFAKKSGIISEEMMLGGAGENANGAGGGAQSPGGFGNSVMKLSKQAQRDAAQESYNLLRAAGADDDLARLVVANQYRESGFDPNAVGDNGKSVGGFQWDATRRFKIFNGTGININNRNMTNADTIKAAIWELKARGHWDKLLKANHAERNRILVQDWEVSKYQQNDMMKNEGFYRSSQSYIDSNPQARRAPAIGGHTSIQQTLRFSTTTGGGFWNNAGAAAANAAGGGNSQ